MDDAVVAEVMQHGGLGFGEVSCAVCLAELEAAKHEEEREDLDRVHS